MCSISTADTRVSSSRTGPTWSQECHPSTVIEIGYRARQLVQRDADGVAAVDKTRATGRPASWCTMATLPVSRASSGALVTTSAPTTVKI